MKLSLSRLIQDFKTWWSDHPLYGERLWAWMRLLFLIFSLLGFVLIRITVFEGINPFTIVDLVEQKITFLRIFPSWLVMFLVPLTEWHYFRYLLKPFFVVLMLLFAGAFYVRDIYHIGKFWPVCRYVFSSMFGFFYPRLTIDSGEMKISEDQINTLREIGGPGFALIQPGNAVIFRHLRSPSRIILSRSYFLKPFETFGQIADLDDQHDYRDEIWAVTIDGIQLHLRDINYRYRLLTSRPDGVPVSRTRQNPYPFSEEAMQDLAYNLPAGATWQSAVRGIVVGEIKEFISSHDIDYLTAPRRNGQNPRLELRTQLLAQAMRHRLKNIGTELLWIDIGHLDIMEISATKQENVDSQRFAYWASRWIGNINRTHAFGEAERLALQERGRVEAQAELLRNITESLRGFDQAGDPAENLRRMLLVRTAQILEGMGEKNHVHQDK